MCNPSCHNYCSFVLIGVFFINTDSVEIPFKNISLVEIIGRGRTANVHSCLFRRKKIAAKCYPVILGKGRLNKIKDELCLIRGLDHPNIIKYLGFSKTKTELVLLMEMASFSARDCDGGDVIGHNLRELLSFTSDGLPWSTRLSLVRETVNGLNFLHSNKIIHGDLKSANLLVIGQEGYYHVKVREKFWIFLYMIIKLIIDDSDDVDSDVDDGD